MAQEAVLVFETELPIPFTVANGTGIERGTLIVLSDPLTGTAHSAANEQCGGIAANEKIASDGKVKLAVYRGGIFKCFASGSITAGDPVTTDGTSLNHFKSARALTVGQLSGSRIWGIALETCTTGETFLMELGPRAQNAGGVT